MKEAADIREYIEALKSSRKFSSQIVCHHVIEPHSPVFRETARRMRSEVEKGVSALGISQFYSHQAEAIDLIRNGMDVVVATPTASGKSMIYNVPVIESYLEHRDSRAMYLFPLKALAQDQHKTLEKLSSAAGLSGNGKEREFSAIYDGDTRPYRRSRLRKHPPPVLITNPDMLHLSMLPYHDTWSLVFKNLQHVVIDEIHTYRGVFGAHMSWVINRLKRICRYYGSNPVFIMLSATIGNPQQLGAKLIGREVALVSRSGAATSRKHMLFLNPWDSAAHTAALLLEASIKRGLRTIVYTKSRKITELITLWTKPRLGELAAKLSAYRAGFLPEERRQVEHDLATGRLLGVISTSALELGIDIGDLDLCVLVGYPGSIMATWQRSGRVGRGGKESAVILIGVEDALDQHFMRNPDDFFRRPPEHAALNPYNTRIMQLHLHCGAAEIPLAADEPLVSGSAGVTRAIETLCEQSVLHQDADRSRWYASRKRPQNQVSLRGGGVQLSIIESASGEIIGEIDAGRALKEAHPGAVYLHHSRILQVERLDIEAREVIVKQAQVNFHTRAKVNKETEIIELVKSRRIFDGRVSWGRLKVTEQVSGYVKVNNYTQKIISTTALDLPEQIIETEGLWFDMDEGQRRFLEDGQMHFMGAIHAVEHAMIAMFPLLILCDRNDIGGISCPRHEQTGCASIFVYDGYAGGAGLSEEAYECFEDLLRQTAQTIRACGCESGCPSCVHSPKCGSGNRPIDKAASLVLLERLISSSRKDQPEDNAVSLPQTAEGAPLFARRPETAPHYRTGLEALPGHYCVFDLETKRSAEEVGSWRNAAAMGVSVAVVYDSQLDGFVTYFEDEAERLIEHLSSCSLVVGFNNRRFDYEVLSAYTRKNLLDLPTLDILEVIKDRLGYRLSLNRLVECTLGEQKRADGLQALKWFKEGKIKEIVDYCRTDVELTRNLFLYALEHGHVLFRNKAGKTVRLPMDLDRRLDRIVIE